MYNAPPPPKLYAQSFYPKLKTKVDDLRKFLLLGKLIHQTNKDALIFALPWSSIYVNRYFYLSFCMYTVLTLELVKFLQDL